MFTDIKGYLNSIGLSKLNHYNMNEHKLYCDLPSDPCEEVLKNVLKNGNNRSHVSSEDPRVQEIRRLFNSKTHIIDNITDPLT